ncbi:phenazine biosynthesis protein phzF [Stachybotrys elegans]|uniref:Phenazine biosynthesis protein phzF n=1 Tax=Stachybotrys elegans TaxID=80388 RepID=A0A8K0SVS5_9HYPO|nr:phenazine biosynthesis protein phzF [Stachybotrys elegans]
MELPFVTFDVFTTTRYRGNPLAVVTIPAGVPKPSQLQKQLVAREFNLSETVFVHDEADHDVKHRQIDIFLTHAEIPFAGHPVIGSAVSLMPLGVQTLITKAGPIAITNISSDAHGHDGLHTVVQAAIPHNVRLHANRLRNLDSDPSLARISAQPAAVVEASLQSPIYSIVLGMSFILVELPSLELLGQVQRTGGPDYPVDKLLDQGWQTGFLGNYYFVRTAAPRDEAGRRHISLRTRMIEGTLEDPATGSAASALCSYLSTTEHTHPDQSFQYDITQGVEMGQDSNISIRIQLKDGKVDELYLSGTAVQVMKGTLTI